MRVATIPAMKLKITNRHRWLAAAGLSSLAAGHLARWATTASWQGIAGDDPPEDPTEPDFDWPTAVLFGAVAGAMVGAAVVLARGGTGAAWKAKTGRRPPRPRKRKRR